jgi:hypothetical protein
MSKIKDPKIVTYLLKPILSINRPEGRLKIAAEK